jgi:cyclopropane fatty-acyl-phospholipid synthase-like methyltransferase
VRSLADAQGTKYAARILGGAALHPERPRLEIGFVAGATSPKRLRAAGHRVTAVSLSDQQTGYVGAPHGAAGFADRANRLRTD